MPKYESHCHLLNVWYFLEEFLHILLDICKGTYPFQPPVTHGTPGSLGSVPLKEEFSNVFSSIPKLEILLTLVASPERHYNYLQAITKLAWHYTGDFYLMPLMMDIYYMFAYQLGEESNAIQQQPDLNQVSIQEAIISRAISLKNWITRPCAGNDKPDSESLLQELDDILTTFKPGGNIVKNTDIKDKWLTIDGFKREREQLLNMVKQGLKIKPFLAIDPRRTEDLEAYARQYVSKNGPFYGFKLYTRFGYHPNCAALQWMYKFCVDHDLPVVVHCSASGFPNLASWSAKYNKYVDPAAWAKILAEYKTLKVNFAHLGDQEGFSGWTKTIVEGYMTRYPNVYADLACFPARNKLKDVKKLIKKYPANPCLIDRLLFGSDFTVMLLFNFFNNPHGMPANPFESELFRYYRNFYPRWLLWGGIFSKDEFNKMTETNPVRFLA